MIKLSMREGLPRVWAAFMASQLQAQKVKLGMSGQTGIYSGPCAVGVMAADDDERRQLDTFDGRHSYASISTLIWRKQAEFSTPDEEADAATLQRAHDNWLRDPTRLQGLNNFVLTLNQLTTKYGLEIPEATAS